MFYEPLSELKTRAFGEDKVAVNVNMIDLPLGMVPQYLLRASTTMNMSRSNGAAGGGPYPRSSYCASPGRKGL